MMDAPAPFEPRTREEVAEHVRAAARDRTPLFVTGGSTAPPHVPPGSRIITMRSLDRIVAYEPGDLTLTAECGVTIAAAQRLLAGHNQFIAFDPADPGRATLGGTIAAAPDGPLAGRCGAIRDQVLGLAVVNGDGRLTHCGGRVVKNVTGYDLCRLYAGSRGALGTIVEATVRVRPLPERARRLDFVFASEDEACQRGWEVGKRVPEIASIQVTSGPAASAGRAGTPATLTTIAAGLEAFVEAAVREIAAAAGLPPASDRDCDPRDLRAARPPAGHVNVTIAAPPSAWRAGTAELGSVLPPATCTVHDLLRGVRESWHLAECFRFPDEPRLGAMLGTLRATLDCPDDPTFRASLATRFPGQAPQGIELMRRLKAALDPAGILNPGTTVFG